MNHATATNYVFVKDTIPNVPPSKAMTEVDLIFTGNRAITTPPLAGSMRTTL